MKIEQINILEKGKSILVFLFLVFIPLAFESGIIEPTNAPRFFFASIFTLIAIVFLVLKKQFYLYSNKPILFLLIGFYLLNLFSYYWSLNSADSIFESQKIILGIGIFVLFVHYLNQKESHTNTSVSIETNFIRTIIITGCIIALFSFYEYYFGTTIKDIKMYTIAGHKNVLSSFLFLFLPFSFYGFFKLKGIWKTISISGIGLILLILFLLDTRSVFLALILSSFFFFLIRKSFDWKNFTRKIVLRVLLVLTLIMTGVFLKYGASVDKNDFSGKITASLVERFALWDKTYQLIDENPILGVGSGNWQYNYSKFSVADIEKALFYNTFFKRPHNDFLWILSENGILGFVLILFIIVLIAKRALKEIYAEKNTAKLVLLAGLVGLMVISFFSFPKERIAHICMTAILLAFVLKDQKIDLRKNRNNFFILPLIILGLLLNIAVGWYRISGEYYTKKAIIAQNNKNPNAAIENGLKALSFFYESDPTCTPISEYIGWGYNENNQLEKLVEENKKSFLLSPYDYKVLSNYGYTLMRIYQFDDARIILTEAYRINPSYESIALNLSVLEFNVGNNKEALDWLEKIPDYAAKYSGNLHRVLDALNGDN